MSGHSKWATIKRQKGAADVKRGMAFTKLGNAITIAVREGGGIGDPEANFKLRLAIDKAKASNMPKENIERAIEKGKGLGKDVILEEVLYEGFAQGGVAMMITAVTDNRLRTNSEVKNIIEKNGGTLGSPGSVSYQFQQKGQINVKKDGKSFDEIFMIAAESGAEDVEDIDDEVIIYVHPQDLKKVKDSLTSNNLSITEAELIRMPLSIVQINDVTTAQKILSLIEKIENQDDVQKVYANFDIPDNILNEIKTV